MHELNNARQISASEFALLGLEQIAYIKPAFFDDGRAAFAIHAADGREVALVEGRDLAFATVQQNDLEPVNVH